MTSNKPDMLLWLDTETTAVDPGDGQLLEVGMILTDMRGEKLTGIDHEGWRWVIRHDAIRLTPKTSYAISELHVKNRLVDEAFGGNSVPSSMVAEEVFKVIGDLADRYTLHPAGTNVDFDIKWIRTGLGLRLTNLHYRRLDLTTLRFLMQQITLGAYFAPATDHRVTTCLNRDIKEYRPSSTRSPRSPKRNRNERHRQRNHMGRAARPDPRAIRAHPRDRFRRTHHEGDSK